ncbi:hypothetical protein MVEN_01335100 [Mycena venus]|uniref:Uncharacterized protein n=1 Tax=Mycena venus TaxID=2733690 RepID=A0A8H7CWW0_9AGAR|nr:hypothetical protein MVEN_01335100 [Mycena venus]
MSHSDSNGRGTDDEINFMWKRARSASAFWFFAVRYAGLVGNIPATVFTFYAIPIQWFDRPRCVLRYVAEDDVSQLIVSIVMLVRIHALYGRNLRLLLILLAISLPPVGVIFWSVQAQGQDGDLVLGFPGCHTSVSQSGNYHLAATWEILFLFDSMIFGLTVFKTYSTWRRTGSEASHLPIHTLVLRDGALYFAIIALVNLCNIVSFYLAGPILSGTLSTFASCMSVTLMARLMLNLHRTADATGDGAGRSLSHIEWEDCNSAVVFRTDGAGYAVPRESDIEDGRHEHRFRTPPRESVEVEGEAETQSLRGRPGPGAW